MRTTLRRSVVTAAASTGLLLTGAAAPALAQEVQQAQAEQPDGRNQPSQNQGDQLSKAEVRTIVIDVVESRVQATGETQVNVTELTDSVVTVDITVFVNDDVQDERGLETELRNAIDQAIQAEVDQGTEVQVNVDVQDDDNGNDGNGGNGQLTEAELRSLVIDVVDRKVQATGEAQVNVLELTDSVVTVDATVFVNDDVEDERALETELRNAIDQAIQAEVDQGTQVQVNVDVQDDDNGNQPNDGRGGRGADPGNGRPIDPDQVTDVPRGSVDTGGQPDGNVVEYVLGGSALAAAVGAGTAATRRFRRDDG